MAAKPETVAARPGERVSERVPACTHTESIHDVTPSALGCEEYLKTGSKWVHLRHCRICEHVGCCDDSPNRHATRHFHKTKHPVIEGYDLPEGWGRCYVDEVFLDLSGRTTPQRKITRLGRMTATASKLLAKIAGKPLTRY